MVLPVARSTALMSHCLFFLTQRKATFHRTHFRGSCWLFQALAVCLLRVQATSVRQLESHQTAWLILKETSILPRVAQRDVHIKRNGFRTCFVEFSLSAMEQNFHEAINKQ